MKCLMKEIYKLTTVVKEMEEKLNMKIDGEREETASGHGGFCCQEAGQENIHGVDVTVCLPGAKIENVTEIVGQVMGKGQGDPFLCVWQQIVLKRKV